MRPILPSDLDAAARVLMVVPPPDRGAVMDQMLVAAEEADGFRVATGRTPVSGGDGSLLAAALARQRAPACAADGGYRDCLALVLERIAAHEGAIARCDEGHHAYMGGAPARIALG